MIKVKKYRKYNEEFELTIGFSVDRTLYYANTAQEAIDAYIKDVSGLAKDEEWADGWQTRREAIEFRIGYYPDSRDGMEKDLHKHLLDACDPSTNRNGDLFCDLDFVASQLKGKVWIVE